MPAGRLVLASVCSICVAAAALLAQPPQPNETANSLARAVFRELVEIPTTVEQGATAQAARAIVARLIGAGFAPEDAQILGPDPRAPLVVARYRGTASTLRPVLFMAHMDVVPARREDWSFDPWTLLERDGWFYGRGTSDNKTGVTSLVANFVRLKREGWRPSRDLIALVTGDEESNQAGLQWLLTERRSLIDAELAINTDSGGIMLRNRRPVLFTVQASEKVYADYRLEVTDSGGHSSLARPDNPIYTLAGALQRLAAHQFPLNVTDVARSFFDRSARVETGQLADDMRAVAQPAPDAAAVARLSAIPFYNARLRTTCVATQVDAGHAPNALPQMARANVNCRILPGESPADVESTVRRLAGDRVNVTVATAPQPSPPSPVTTALLDRLERLVAAKWPGVPVAPIMEAGATDGAYVRRAGIPTYGVSALTQDPDDVRAHGKDERVSVSGFFDAVDFWYRLMKVFGESASLADAVSVDAPSPTAPPESKPPSYPGYSLVWADEFSRTGEPDPKDWTDERGFVRNRELQWYQPQNARQADGLLIIEARRERVANPSYEAGSSDWRRSREFAEYSSASLMTRGLHSWRYGRFEMRGRIDTRAGLWPAFWSLGIAGDWPHNGEIDIMEYYRGILLANVAWGGAKRFEAIWADSRKPIDSFKDAEWSSAFHVWRMDWDERAIVLSVDGERLNEVLLSRTVNQDATAANPFHQPQYLLLNLAVGGTQGGDPSQTTFPARFEIDYVRVYQAAAHLPNLWPSGGVGWWNSLSRQTYRPGCVVRNGRRCERRSG